jgi:hypothetical protein
MQFDCGTRILRVISRAAPVPLHQCARRRIVAEGLGDMLNSRFRCEYCQR